MDSIGGWRKTSNSTAGTKTAIATEEQKKNTSQECVKIKIRKGSLQETKLNGEVQKVRECCKRMRTSRAKEDNIQKHGGAKKRKKTPI